MPELYDRKKQAIMSVAHKIFAKYGYYKTTLDDIAENLGMKKNSLYYYFPNKESLFNELIKIEAEAFLLDLKNISSLPISQEAKVEKFFGRFVILSKEREVFYYATVNAFLEIHEIIQKSNLEYKQKTLSEFENILKVGIKKKEFRKHDTRKTSETLLNLASAVIQKEYYESQAEFMREIDTSKAEENLKFIARLILNGLKCK